MIENGEESDSKAFDDDDDEDNDEDQVENIDQDNEMIDSINGDSSSINQMITNDDGLQSAAANASITDEIMISDGEIDGDDEDDDGDENENENDEGMIVTDPAASTTSKNNDVVSKLNSNSFDKPQNLVSKSSSNSSKNNQSLINNNKITEEIVIDDDEDEDVIDDEDEVQDLSTNKSTTKHVKEQQPQEQEMKQEDNSNNNNNNEKTSIEDLIPKLSDELTGFPKFFQNVLTLGDCIAINKKSRSDIDIDKDYSILDCPSQVVPLIIKRANKFPPKLKTETSDQTTGQKPPPPPPSQSNQQSNNTKNMLTISDFYSSSVGKFLMGIGLSRVKQWYHKDAINKVRKQIRKEGDAEDLMEELKKQQEYLTSCRVANASYIFPTIKCEHCDFRSEFQSVIQNHMAYPHQTSRKELKCNYCQFSTRDSKVIIDHVQCMHERKCLIELPPQLYECPICPYESGVKSKAATHIAKCLKFFLPEKLLANKDDYFPTITPKPITQEDIKIYEATLQALRFAALNPQTKVPQIAGLPPGLQQQMYLVQQQQMNRIAPSGRNKKHHHHHHQQSAQPFDAHQAHSHPQQQQQQQAQSSIMAHSSSSSSSSHKMNRHNNASNLAANANQMALHYRNAAAPQLYNMLANTQIAAQLFQNAAAAGLQGLSPNALSLLNKPHMLAKLQNITPPGTVSGLSASHQPHHSSSRHNTSSNSKSSIISNKHHHHQQQQQQPNNLTVGAATVANNPKGSFVMCEICDGYIKDLEQLRTHMQWIHKVRIHPKMLASRPPLNCQKCQWRFFTDQGLERHLLGSHGLVTSNMQEMVNRNEDGGRCTICGRVFTSKLVTHMNQAHKINLKPAHLSYKCTVCSATFNLYRLFENHVYMVHSGSVKRNTNSADNETTMPPRKKAALDMSANGN
uniref:MOG interacting and ectopic P-granules protein 1 n=1 Tax=Dermatophagoides pteronyssinus TaxID=6956 RepID=A0A6P6XY86_DERPT|nr:MOG interacting and ectopic P-granules protein 1-like [Dermatophagoides pteronyssinus]